MFFDPFTEPITLFHLPLCPQRDTLTLVMRLLFIAENRNIWYDRELVLFHTTNLDFFQLPVGLKSPGLFCENALGPNKVRNKKAGFPALNKYSSSVLYPTPDRNGEVNSEFNSYSNHGLNSFLPNGKSR
jgi:hypothetical protein